MLRWIRPRQSAPEHHDRPSPRTNRRTMRGRIDASGTAGAHHHAMARERCRETPRQVDSDRRCPSTPDDRYHRRRLERRRSPSRTQQGRGIGDVPQQSWISRIEDPDQLAAVPTKSSKIRLRRSHVQACELSTDHADRLPGDLREDIDRRRAHRVDRAESPSKPVDGRRPPSRGVREGHQPDLIGSMHRPPRGPTANHTGGFHGLREKRPLFVTFVRSRDRGRSTEAGQIDLESSSKSDQRFASSSSGS